MLKVGFIGLGVMGKPMARNLLQAGYPLVAHNRSREPVEELAAEGAERAFSPAEVAERAEVVITCLPDSPDVELVALGPEGIIEGIGEGSIYVDMSTISPVTTEKVADALAEKGAKMLDAPISGGEEGAINGTLSIMVGGPEEAFEICSPLFEVMGSKVTHVGGTGAGQVVKACNQIVVGMTLTAVAEALVLGSKAGVDPEKIVEAISGGAARCWALEQRAPWMIQRNFEPGFKSAYHYKDLGIAMDTARAFGVSLPASGLVYQLYGAMKAMDRGEWDHSAIVTLIEELAQTEIASD
ncbi:MAG: 2-hydroxy-3-oxopropionate reductase [Chloroflexota bacterium]|nr:2-hydroxy-3-oxopropionate reductase [Chloroflexota bacterium]